jgi:t-SNARE complex subunit (syntaxin)
MITTLTRKFVDEMKMYQQAQQQYKTDLKSKVKRQVLVVKPDATDEEVDAVMKSEGGRDALYKERILAGGVNDQIKYVQVYVCICICGVAGCILPVWMVMSRRSHPISSFVCRTTYAKVAGKYQDVLTLEQSVAELHQMFLDFALLTEQQGELLDQIEFQVKQAGDYVEEANVDVHQSIEYQKKIRKKQWCVLYYCSVDC